MRSSKACRISAMQLILGAETVKDLSDLSLFCKDSMSPSYPPNSDLRFLFYMILRILE